MYVCVFSIAGRPVVAAVFQQTTFQTRKGTSALRGASAIDPWKSEGHEVPKDVVSFS